MSGDYQPTPEFHQWLTAAAEGNLDEQAAAEMGQVLRSDPAARAYYVDYMSVHALLQWRHGAVPPLEMPLAAPASVQPQRKTVYMWPALAVAAVVLIAASLTVILAWRAWGVSETGQQPIAIVLDQTGTQWNDGTSLASDQQLHPGRRRIAAGEARIQLSSGVMLAMQGPVDFEITSPEGLHLRRGKLRVYSPLATAGFTVTTPRGVQIVDLGTAFGVWAGEDHSVEVHLFDGKLRVNDQRILTSGQAVKIDPDGTVQVIAVDESLFPSLHSQ